MESERCWRCGKKLICQSNFMLSEWDGIDAEPDDDAIVTIYSCPFCGAEYTVTDTPRNQMEYYPYFKNRNDI